MDERPGLIVVAVALGVIAILAEIGSAVGYAYYASVSFDQFIASHPFDVLSVAVWYAAGTWLARHIRSLLGVLGLSYGLAVAGLVSVLAEPDPWSSALVQAAVAGTVMAVVIFVALIALDGGGKPPGWAHTGEAIWFMVGAAAVALYLEFTQPQIWLIPFSILGLASAGALVVGRLIGRHGLKPGAFGAPVEATGAQAKHA